MCGDHEDERYPSFATVRRQNIIDPAVGRSYVEKTLEYIEFLPGQFYSTTDLSSSYGSIEHYLDLGIIPNIIVLRRDPRLVAASYFALDFISRASIPCPTWERWKPSNWYPFPGEPKSLPVDLSTRLHSYQNCYWLCCDNEWRAQRYLSLVPNFGCKVWETSISQILDKDHFNSMMDHFDLPKIKSTQSEKVDIYAKSKLREVPPREFLHNLELDVLDRIPVDFKMNLLSNGWGQL